MAVSKRLRYEILRRDNHACRYCGQMAPDIKLTVDHVVPVALGGLDVAENLVAACAGCNAGKAASNPDAPLVADVAQAAIKWQQAIQLATDLNLRDRERLNPQISAVHNYWFERFDRKTGPYPTLDSESYVRKWLARGLTVPEMADFVDITYAKWVRDPYLGDDNTWTYFAGCCWKRLTQIEEQARALIDQGEV